MLLSKSIQQSIRLVAERQMGVPLLLFLAGHQPLAFVLGQCCHVLNPMASLLGYPVCGEWATLFSDPKGPAQLEQFLEQESRVNRLEKTG